MRSSRRVGRVLALFAVLGAVGCGSASAASPVLEFSSQSTALPVSFDAQGGAVTAALSDFDTVVHCEGSRGSGAIIAARRALSSYTFTGCETREGSKGGQQCKSAGAQAEEITTPTIEAELVFVDQAKKEVGMLLDPDGGIYMEFECGGEEVKAFGPFVSPVGPLNQEGTSFTASLFRSGATQVPSAYESLTGEKLSAVPSGERGSQPAANTGVELSFTIHTAQPLAIKAITAAEVDANQRDEEAAARKRHDDEEAAKAAAAKKQAEEAVHKRQEEDLAAAAKAAERRHLEAKTRARRLSKSLKQCRKANAKQKRVRCERRAKKRFAAPRAAAH